MTVQNFSGGNWSVVGAAGFSTHSAARISVTTDSSGTPYVLFIDQVTQVPVVMSFTAGNWSAVGNIGGQTNFAPSLAIDSTGVPYVAFVDSGNSDAVTVVSYAAATWNAVGTAQAAAAGVSALVVDGSDNPYVGFIDAGNGDALTVLKYSTGAWAAVGTAGSGTPASNNVSLCSRTAGSFIWFIRRTSSDNVVVMNSERWRMVDQRFRGLRGLGCWHILSGTRCGRASMVFLSSGNLAPFYFRATRYSP